MSTDQGAPSDPVDKPKPGSICWHDLTVPNAEPIRDFYKQVVGWTSGDVDMGGYSDYTVQSDGSEAPVAGVCHARGMNADLPPQWLMYIIVEDVDQSAETCKALGGKVLAGPRSLGGARFCVIQDPAGAVCALYQP